MGIFHFEGRQTSLKKKKKKRTLRSPRKGIEYSFDKGDAVIVIFYICKRRNFCAVHIFAHFAQGA